MIDYLNQHPTASEILAAVHEVKPKSVTLRNKVVSQSEFEGEFSKVSQIMGEFPDRAPDDFKESFKYAEELKQRMGIGKAGEA